MMYCATSIQFNTLLFFNTAVAAVVNREYYAFDDSSLNIDEILNTVLQEVPVFLQWI